MVCFASVEVQHAGVDLVHHGPCTPARGFLLVVVRYLTVRFWSPRFWLGLAAGELDSGAAV